MNYFFTYGSWTNPEKMQELVGNYKAAVRATLPNYIYTFSGEHPEYQGGTSTMISMPGGTVLGVAYLLTDEQLTHIAAQSPQHNLEEQEGMINDQKISMQLLRLESESKVNQPSPAYLDQIRSGLNNFFNPVTVDMYLSRAVRYANQQELAPQKQPLPDTFKKEYGGDFRRLFPWNVTREQPFGSAWMIVFPSDNSSPHSHDEEETFIFLNGEGIMSVDGKKFPVRKGDAVYLEPFSAHTVQNTGKDPLEVLCIWWGGVSPT